MVMSDPSSKISPALRSRLKALNPADRVRAVILLALAAADPTPRRRSRANRRASVAAARALGAEALAAVDKVLVAHGGSRLAGGANALGYVSVEVPAAAVDALAQSNHVKAILEDQAL